MYSLTEIKSNRPQFKESDLIGEIIVRNPKDFIIQQEQFNTRSERKQLYDKLKSLYKEKLTNRGWTISILLQ